MWQITKMGQLINKYKGLVGILPALLFMLFFFLGGAIQALVLSLGGANGMNLQSHTSRFWAYRELWDPSFLHSLGVTVGIAAAIAVLSGIAGLAATLFLAGISHKWKWVIHFCQLPMGVPHLLAAYLFMQVFMQSGWYARAARYFGWIDSFEEFPVLVHDDWGAGVILAYLWKEIPFIIMLIYPFILKLLSDWKEQAGVLGASLSQTVRWIIIPILLPLWAGGMWVVFAFALGAYEIPALIARTSLGSIPVLAWQEYTQFGLERQPVAIAMNMALALVSLLVGCVLIYLQLKWYKQGRRVW